MFCVIINKQHLGEIFKRGKTVVCELSSNVYKNMWKQVGNVLKTNHKI